MTIVANDSITVSNVNDGTITHTAWSYSADGMDGFTTVYPSLNLLTDSKDFKNKNVAESATTTSITSPSTTIFKEGNDTCLNFIKSTENQDWFRAYMIRGSSVSPNFPNVDVKSNTHYTFSVWLKGTGTHQIIAYNNWTSPNPTTLTVTLADNWTKYVLTVNTANTIPTQGAQFFIRSGTMGSEINLKYPKVEPGSIATPYMQSTSEVTTADWPKYRGEYSDISSEQSTNPSKYTWSTIRGDDGIAGNDGVGVTSTVITYAISTSGMTAPSTGWTSSVPSLVKGQYFWTKTIWSYTDNSSETGYSVTYISKDGNNGTDGVAGKDGVGIKTTIIEYVGAVSGTTKPTSGWTTTIPSVAAGSFLWTRTTLTYTDNTTEQVFSVAKMGNTGATGPKGDPGNNGTNGIAGKDGNGIKSTTITYTISTSVSTAPSTGWTSSVPSLIKGQYLWTKTAWTYTDNSSETGYTVSYISKDGNNGTNGLAGKDGVGISSTTITYASHTNGTTAPTTGYTSTVPSVPAGQFLWTKTVWTYTDNSSETGYSVAMMGVKGDKGDPGNNGTNGVAGKDGKGIKATAITYQASSNGTTAPTGTWSASVPTVAKGSFLWTRTIWTYTDNTTETGYAVAYMGTNGNNGTNGLAGKDGVGIKTTTITYVGSTSGTTAPTSGWTATVPTVAAGSYLWTKTVWAYTDNTSETGYSVAMMGLKGDKGDPGNNGTDGTSGIIVSSVAPASPKTGQLWQDTSTTPQLVKKWTGSSWVIWELYVENMNVNNLSALSPNLGTITGGSYESWSSDINQESGNVNFNGIYIKNGKNRSLTIIYPENTTPDKNTFKGGLYTGTQTGNDGISYFAINSNQMDNITPHELLTELDNPYGFWERRSLNNISSYAGNLFTSYKDGISHGLAFDSPNGLSVLGDLSVTGSVTTNTTSSVTVILFYSITGIFRRQGNLVTVSFERQVRAPQSTGEDKLTNEKVPSGYRPSYSHYFEISRNVNTTVKNGLIMGIAPNGDVRITLGETGSAAFSGSTSYFTEDPLP